MSANATLTTGSSLRADEKKALSLLKHTVTQLESEAITLDELSRFNAHQSPFENASKAYSTQIEKQLKYFRDRWGFAHSDEEFGGLYVPRPSGYCKTLLIVPRDLSGPEDIFGKWIAEKKFEVSKYTDNSLSDLVPNDKRRLGHYALLHGGQQVADDVLKNRSWEQNNRGADALETMRLTEVLLFEDVFFTETKGHIDPDTATLTGSRGGDGLVPRVRWRRRNRELDVNWYFSQYADPTLRARAVSL